MTGPSHVRNHLVVRVVVRIDGRATTVIRPSFGNRTLTW